MCLLVLSGEVPRSGANAEHQQVLVACGMCLHWQEQLVFNNREMVVCEACARIPCRCNIEVSVPACNGNVPIKVKGRWRLPVGNDGFVTLPALS